MELNEIEKRLLFQVEGDYQSKVLNELYMTAQYTKNPEQRKAAENLMAKLRVLTDAECMDIVRDIQKNYRLPYRLSLGGTSHVALIAFLERHPEIRRVNLYMDNDLGGLKNARRIQAMLHEDRRFRHIRVGVNPPRTGKDYNEKLLRIREQIQERQQPRRQKEAAVSI